MGMLSFESEVTFVAISLFLLPVANSNGYDFIHIRGIHYLTNLLETLSVWGYI